jgi:hypothetical protein
MWIANKQFVEKFLKTAKQAIYLCENAPENIKEMLYSDPNYNGSIKHLCMEKFGIPHYPFHPFILENLICLLSHIENN